MDTILDITLLRTFVAIREHGGFGRAAAALRCSQPTVSQHVRVLERRLGRALVEKDGRVTRFTPVGERLLVEARLIIAVHDDALARLAEPAAADPAAPAPAPAPAPALAESLPEVQDAERLSEFLRFLADRTPQLLPGFRPSSER